jgi:uncharacterized glyoxalase superfamily protein PhnB
MPVFTKLTPNLLVASVERSLAFYVDTLGFTRGMTVPDQSPFAFGSVTGGPVEIFFNDAAGAVKVVMPIETKFYGMREFAIEDPDGYVITFAERVNGALTVVHGR